MKLNPVEQSLMAVQYHWQNFMAQDDKRMLVWQIKENALRLVDVFFKVQQEERLSEKPYVSNETFIVFDQPFENSVSYAETLKKSLAAHYEATRAAIEATGGAADWSYAPESQPDSPQALIQGLNALADHHKGLFQTLVAVIMPSRVASDGAWTDWLGRALQAGPAERLRLIVIDLQEHPRCAALSASAHPQLHVESIPIDAIDLAADTFAQEPAGGVAGVFRNLLTGLFNLVDKGTPEQVMLKADDAIAFALRNGLPDQEVVVRLMSAGAMLKAQRFDTAVNHYRHARLSAEKLQKTGHPGAKDLILQGWFGEASAHFAAQNLPETIRCYREAGPVAEAIPKPILWLESLRMGAFCHRLNGDEEAALRCCEQALAVGERMQPEARIVTTLPLVGMEMLGILDHKRTKKLEGIKRKLDADLTQRYAAMEQSASRLEREPNARDALKGLATQLEIQSQTLEQSAGETIERLVQSGSPPYIQVFDRIRALLWPTWPLEQSESNREEDAVAESAVGGVSS
jgi:hypothetical protein